MKFKLIDGKYVQVKQFASMGNSIQLDPKLDVDVQTSGEAVAEFFKGMAEATGKFMNMKPAEVVNSAIKKNWDIPQVNTPTVSQQPLSEALNQTQTAQIFSNHFSKSSTKGEFLKGNPFPNLYTEEVLQKWGYHKTVLPDGTTTWGIIDHSNTVDLIKPLPEDFSFFGNTFAGMDLAALGANFVLTALIILIICVALGLLYIRIKKVVLKTK